MFQRKEEVGEGGRGGGGGGEGGGEEVEEMKANRKITLTLLVKHLIFQVMVGSKKMFLIVCFI